MIGKILGGRYEIVEKVGGGGMALVYKAKCNLLNRYVAVKILRSEFTSDKDIIEKFKRESQAAASLSHPNIVNLYDVGEEDDIYYIVMEYVKGRTLKEVIKEKGILTLNEIINYTKQIALALQHAHYNHVIHRDIKPHNILITEDNRAKVTDFGIAIAASSSTITNMGSVIGSVHYFSPEQARGGYIDEKSDLYSLGIVMYEMATGTVPFEGDSPITVALKHIQQDPVPPSEVYPAISKNLEEIILKLMQKDQASRYQNAQSLIVSLGKLKEDAVDNEMTMMLNHEDSPTQIIPRIKEEDFEVPKVSAPKPAPKSKKSNNKLVIAAAIVAALIAALLFTFGLFYVSNLNFFRTEEVVVPGLEGKNIEEAREIVKELGLQLEERSTHTTETPINEIISQETNAGMKVKPGYTIRVVVSAGPDMANVPDLIHEDAVNVPLLLANRGLKAGTPREEFSEFPIGTVIDQNPRGGSSLPAGSTVDYVVSKGPQVVTFSMPTLIGETRERAEAILRQQQLEIGNVSEGDSNEYAKGLVIFQSIPPETQVSQNTVVNLIISRGPEVIQEPEDITPPEDEPEEGQEEEQSASTNLSTQNVTIQLQGHKGIVELVIKRVSDGGEIYNRSHNVDNEGNRITIPVTGYPKEEFELFVNGQKHSKNIKLK
ncbi:Stk1 family PASTA domain-containing Ser/Thr kinase [Clostridium formicaceticum]|uniref:non-specific serine/threonine protein kinase n=1 Tax=Clostridium formicaceticum TaxID=1497 RepID=A0AAC9WGG6_9CLOT|nr:Stk1 family PASTA domain-containing Ser/Thr kinase [Clostridium formicaceticum]AOY77367.1 protein kinase [Clostridium formicaceticum]ARE87913.1 Serine/threonine-protein kinase PrkC [Clostridium formicaceticum]